MSESPSIANPGPLEGAYPWPEPDGPHPVGVVQFDLTDPGRICAFAPDRRMGRRLSLAAWYPAKPGAGRGRKPYMSLQETVTLHALLDELTHQEPGSRAYLAQTLTAAEEGAEIDAGLGPLPIVLFCHGGFSHNLQNTALMESLASRGYLAISVAHPFESGGVVWRDGTFATTPTSTMQELMGWAMKPEAFGSVTGTDPLARLEAAKGLCALARRTALLTMLEPWAQDMVWVADALRSQTLPAEVAFLARAADARRLAYVGMSYGGPVSYRACDLDPGARAGVNLDGNHFTWDMYDRHARTPFLVVQSDPRQQAALMKSLGVDVSSLDGPLTPATPLVSDLFFEPLHAAGLRPDVVRVSLPGLAHMAMTDLPIVSRAPHRPGLGEGPLCGPRGVAAVNRLCGDFLDRHVRGLGVDSPGSALAAFPEVVRRDLTAFREAARRGRGL